MYNYDWSELAFASKKAINELDAIFIAAPRDISTARFKQLVREYLPKGNLLLGLAKESYIDGFNGQPQFKTLRLDSIEKTIKTINDSGVKNKVYTLNYFQRDLKFIVEKLKIKRAIFINGSWQYLFHNSPTYYVLASKKIDYERLSPFSSEQEAQNYDAHILPPEKKITGLFDSKGMLKLADEISVRSFDHAYQTGASLGRKKANKYQFIARTFNKVVPYQTYAMHYGSVREDHFSPTQDLNYYDTVHAEVMLLIKAQKQNLDLSGTTLFINLLPCPNCARMIGETDITDIVYRQDHSDGMAATLLEKAGKKIRRIVE